MMILFAIALLVGLTVVPVMVGARVVGANNTGFGSALLAVLVLAALSIGIGKFIGNQFLAFVVSVAAGGLLLSTILDTSFWRGIGVGVVVVIVQYIVMLLFAGLLIGSAAVAG
jgi:hypothetical protein